MDLSEISNAIKATLYDRIKNPLLGAFIVSWCVINHRAIIVIFSTGSYADKFAYIDRFVFGCDSFIGKVLSLWGAQCGLAFYFASSLIYSLLLPAIAAFVFIKWIPTLTAWGYRKSLESTKELKSIKNDIEGHTLLTQKESDEIRLEMLKQESMYANELQKMTDANTQLRRLAEVRENRIKDLENDNSNRITAINSKLNNVHNNRVFWILGIKDNSTQAELSGAYITILCACILHFEGTVSINKVQDLFIELTGASFDTFNTTIADAIDQKWVSRDKGALSVNRHQIRTNSLNQILALIPEIKMLAL